MPYGNGKEREDWLKRAVPLGVGELNRAKRAALTELRSRVLALMREMAAAGFSPEPLREELRGEALDERLLETQKDCSGLNSVWREQARLRVKPALEESAKRYFARLSGGLRFVDQEIPEQERQPDEAGRVRRYYHVPTEIQDTVTAAELEGLKVFSGSKAADLFRAVILEGATDFEGEALTPAQITILTDIHARAQARHTCPAFASQDGFTLQLHIDSRMLPVKDECLAKELRQEAAVMLEDKGNRRYRRFLALAGIEARGPRIKIPVSLSHKIAQRFESSNTEWASLIVELSEQTVGVRLVAGKPPHELPKAVRALIGRDFGYANTVALSVAMFDEPIELPTKQIRLETKEKAREFFASHALPGNVRIVERLRFEGRNFLARIDHHCRRIDGLRSRIDTAYNALDALRAEIASGLRLGEEDRIEPAMKRGPLGDKVREFFHLLGQIQDLKNLRRALYRKIAALKKAWFGFLSNIEATLARDYDAAVVREDLDIVAIEKDSPAYKGRTFNKMLNNGSKGQYRRRASGKLLWNGIPEVAVPSWYTSRVCLTHSAVVDKKHRRGESLFLPCCNRHDHADEHAGDTLAGFLFLRPRLALGLVTPAIPPAGSSGL